MIHTFKCLFSVGRSNRVFFYGLSGFPVILFCFLPLHCCDTLRYAHQLITSVNSSGCLITLYAELMYLFPSFLPSGFFCIYHVVPYRSGFFPKSIFLYLFHLVRPVSCWLSIYLALFVYCCFVVHSKVFATYSVKQLKSFLFRERHRKFLSVKFMFCTRFVKCNTFKLLLKYQCVNEFELLASLSNPFFFFVKKMA